MRSPAYGSFPRNIRNPTLVAMVGSVGFHGLLAIISVLKPAESQPGRLRIVSLAPPGAAQTLPSTSQSKALPVPNGVPPISLSQVPPIGQPGIGPFALPMGSLVPKSSISSSDLQKLRTANLPERSFASVTRSSDLKQPSFGRMERPNSQIPLQSPEIAKLPPIESGFGSSRSERFSPPTSPQYSNLPPVPSAPLANNGLDGFYGGQPQPLTNPDGAVALSDPTIPGNQVNTTESVGAPPDQTSSVETKSGFKKWLQAKSQLYGQQISSQQGRPLVAVNSQEACDAKQDGTALVSAIYAPNGTLAGSESIEILESASTPALNQAALRAVKKYRPEPAEVYQALTFKVAIPYSEAVCQTLQPKTATPQPSGAASSKSTPVPASELKIPVKTPEQKPSVTPTAIPTPAAQSKPTATPILSPKEKTRPATPSLNSPSTSPLRSEPLVSPAVPIEPSSLPSPTPKTKNTDSSSTPKTDSSILGPLPAPAISPSETAPSPSP